MIELVSWESSLGSEIELKNKRKYSVTFTSTSKHDDRSDWSFKYLASISEEIHTVQYDPHEITVSINDIEFSILDILKIELPKGNILIDATSLALPEILHLFRIMKEQKLNFDVFYVQPTGYTESNDKGIDKIKTFDLSDDGLGVQQVPPFVSYTSNSKLLIFLGFEGHRFGSIINSDELNSNDIDCLIGAPPFKLGWENKTLSNNYTQLIAAKNNSSSQFWFAGANDPVETYKVLHTIYSSADYQDKSLCLAPFGTKPAAIAAAQFAVNNDGTVMLYDFVRKKNKRSSGTDLAHIWEFKAG